ncbi:transcription factor bHLH112 [Phoenix dactylifera]|uniref:Transcription factor bHLH112 n=1 Tax=Phoenix dactylifera TaxID=42345 RepID=A0A8B7MUI0_PHODC|nr:transcription factor bHLH112 [Phoenix dactylifera]
MAEEFQTGICNSGSWWSTGRTGGFDGPVMSTSVSCSTEFTWAAGADDMVQAKSRSYDESPGSVSNSSITFQDTHKPQASDQLVANPIMDSTLQVSDFGLSSPLICSNQPFLMAGERAENNLHALLQEDMSSGSYLRNEPVMESNQIHMNVESSSLNLIEDLKQGLMQGQHHWSSSANSCPLFPASFGLPPALLQGLFEPETRPRQSFNNQTMNSPMSYHGVLYESSQSQVAKLPQFDKALPVKQQLHLSNNTPFWNPSATATTETSLGLYSSTPTGLALHALEGETNRSNLLVQSNSEGAGESRSNTMKKSSNEPALKKPRMETPSPLPTFKVRKEKLGDRVTALQQLVSPFGKTDTASVLHEAIEYIKFLHEQVGVLSAPYLKNGHQMQHSQNFDETNDGEGPQIDLTSRGLCLVPISSTFAVASETPVDFWTPTFGGTYR